MDCMDTQTYARKERYRGVTSKKSLFLFVWWCLQRFATRMHTLINNVNLFVDGTICYGSMLYNATTSPDRIYTVYVIVCMSRNSYIKTFLKDVFKKKNRNHKLKSKHIGLVFSHQRNG